MEQAFTLSPYELQGIYRSLNVMKSELESTKGHFQTQVECLELSLKEERNRRFELEHKVKKLEEERNLIGKHVSDLLDITKKIDQYLELTVEDDIPCAV